MAIPRSKSRRYLVFGRAALPDGDHRRDETAHHVVTERLGANGESKRGRVTRAHDPLVVETLPARGEHAAQERLVRRRRSVGRLQNARKSCGAEHLGARRDSSPPRSSGPVTDHAQAFVESRPGGVALEDEVAILAPGAPRSARETRRLDRLGAQDLNPTAKLLVERAHESFALKVRTFERRGQVDVDDLGEGVHTGVGASRPRR